MEKQIVLKEKLLSLADPENGVLKAQIYSDEEIYRLELEKIFSKSWLFLCPESQIPNPGDYFVSYMGADPVIVARQQDGSVVAFLNQCRHRGGALCRGESGNTKAFTCTYHGWSYDSTGELISIPYENLIYPTAVDRKQWSAKRVPRIEIDNGLIFGCWDENVIPFRESLGESSIYFDLNFARSNKGMEALSGVYKWKIKANWKLMAEQFCSDAFHFLTTHTSAVEALVPPNSPSFEYIPGRSFSSKEGHGGGFMLDENMIKNSMYITAGQVFTDYVLDIEQPNAVEKFGETLGSAYPIYANFFPNLAYLHSNRTLRIWIPRSADEVEVWAWTMVEKDASDEIKAERNKQTARTFGPSGIFEQDDTANWIDVQRPLNGFMSQRTELNVQMGKASNVDGWPGLTDIDNSEAGSRRFYSAWLNMLVSD